MTTYSSRYTDPAMAHFVRQHGPTLGFQNRALWEAFKAEFGEHSTGSFSSFEHFARRIRGGGEVVPRSPMASLADQVAILKWRTFMVVSDHQVPYYDAELTERSVEIAKAWNVEGIVINGDLWDMATISKFSPSLYGERIPLGDELRLGRQIIGAYAAVAPVLLIPGNHEWRLILKLLGAELDSDMQGELLTGGNGKVMFTPLSWAICDAYAGEPIRITHPKAASVIAGSVGADISRNFDCHVIVAHDHLLAQRRSHSGRWSVTHTGMMADRTRLAYSFTSDSRRPLMNSGFALVHPSTEGRPVVRLFDPLNVSWDHEKKLAAASARLITADK